MSELTDVERARLRALAECAHFLDGDAQDLAEFADGLFALLDALEAAERRADVECSATVSWGRCGLAYDDPAERTEP